MEDGEKTVKAVKVCFLELTVEEKSNYKGIYKCKRKKKLNHLSNSKYSAKQFYL